ncbi:srh-269 [Pristionchus pacificus]|uniref:G protein-coupled receptor n=1 Tax=Pristionchus pacificus TaxID=54126 RepID=A0A2A6C2Y7_PRIPA|nr:srh-269 [Pristionchus pacificus]|eukprot:PDM72535.1 G protein-coupled receptor [Pristionchus pacificus]
MENNPFKLKECTKHLIRSWLFILFSIAPVALMLQSDDEMEMVAMIESVSRFTRAAVISNPHNITWIRDRGMYMIVEKTPEIIVIISTILLILFIAFCSLIFMFVHMFIVLQTNSNNRSRENTRRVRKSLLVLLIQLIVPLELLVFPATIMFIGLLAENWISFEISLIMYLIITLHSIGHNVILLLITPLYRNFILYFIARHLLRQTIVIPQKSVSVIKMSFYLPLSIQDDIFQFQRIVFLISTILNVISLICLFKQTPPHQTTFKNYVILIQVSITDWMINLVYIIHKVLLTLSDINLDILLAPIPLFPLPAGYCVGLLCRAKVSMRLQLVHTTTFGSTILFFTNTGVAIIICVLYRHQTILMESNLFKLKERTKHLIRSWLFMLFSIAPVAFMLQSDDEIEMESLIDSNLHNISWIRERGMYFIVEKTPDIVVIISIILLVLLTALSSLIFMFGHMFVVLNGNVANNRSKENIRRIRKSLLVLLIQLIVPLELLVLPAIVLAIGLLTENWITFEISLVVYLIITLHSIGHNVILVLITPLYRNFIAYFISRHLLRKTIIIPQKSVSVIQVTVTR